MSQFVFPSGCVARSLLGAGAQTANVNGPAVDVRDLNGPIMVLQTAGAGSGTTPTLGGKIQDSPDGSTGWADIPNAAFTGVTDEAAAAEKLVFPQTATRGFIRYVGTIGGTTPSFAVGVVALGMKRYG